MEIIELKSRTVISDSRGELEEIVKAHLWKQMNRVRTNQGCIRGNHYHKYLSELHYVLDGELKVQIKNLRTKEESEYQFGKGSCFIVEPYEFHTVEHLTDADYIVLFSEEFNPQNPDIHKDIQTYAG